MRTSETALIRLAGPFRIEGPDGGDLTPPGKRSKALIAMLALAPEGVRSRSWLQDRLWSDRPQAQGSASLRQELSSLRRCLSLHGVDLFTTDRDTVRLDRARVRLDIETDDPSLARQELLEGLDICDSEFEEWLRLERSRWSAQAETLSETHVLGAITAPDAARTRPVLGLLASCAPADITASDYLLDVLSRTVLGFDVVDVADFRTDNGAVSAPPVNSAIDWMLRTNVSAKRGVVLVSVSLYGVGDGKRLWSYSAHIPLAELYCANSVTVAAFVNRVAARTLDLIDNPRSMRDSQRYQSARCALGAIYQICRLGDRDLDAAESLLCRAYALEPRSSYLGWRLLAAVTRIGERRITRSAAFDEQTRELMVQAVDSDPYNALTLALTAHAHSFIFHEYEYALGLLDRATDIDPMQPIALDMRGLTLGYLGEAERGYADAMRARSIGPPPPYEFLVDATCCVLATLSGRYAEGVVHGRRVLARKPNFLPALRYTAACEGLLERKDEAARTLRRLRQYEPDFTVEMLRQPDYPVAGILGASLIEKGLAGLELAHHTE